MIRGLRDARLAPLVALTALAAALRFSTLDLQSFWLDEAFTVRLVRFGVERGPGEMLGVLPESEANPPLYYLLAWTWAKVFGTGEVGLRSFSALAGTAIVPVAYAAATQLSTRRVGLAAAALAAVSPLLVWYSQEARAYALVALFGGLSFLFFAEAVRSPTGRALACWALASVAALATHYLAGFLVVPEAAWLLLSCPRRRLAVPAVAATALAGAALLPLAVDQRTRGNIDWIAGIPMATRLRQVPEQYLIGVGSQYERFAVVGTACLCLVALLLVALRADAVEKRAAAVGGALAAATLALPLGLAIGGADYVITRNVIVAWVPLAIVVAAGLGARGAARGGSLATAGLCLFCVAIVVSVALEPRLQRPDWRGVADALGPPKGGRAVVITAYGGLPLSLYLAGARPMPPQGSSVSEVVRLTMRGARRGCWWGAACNLPSRPASTRPPAAGFALAGRRDVGLFTLITFRSKAARRLTRSALLSRRRGEGSAVLVQGH